MLYPKATESKLVPSTSFEAMIAFGSASARNKLQTFNGKVTEIFNTQLLNRMDSSYSGSCRL